MITLSWSKGDRLAIGMLSALKEDEISMTEHRDRTRPCDDMPCTL